MWVVYLCYLMAEPTLTSIFGSAATQNSTTLTISKSDLATVGLTPLNTNTAESLFVALLMLAKNQLSPANQDLNLEQNVTVSEQDFDYQTLISRNNTTYRQTTYTVRLQKVDTSSAIDPDDY